MASALACTLLLLLGAASSLFQAYPRKLLPAEVPLATCRIV